MLLPFLNFQATLGFYQEILTNCFYNNISATYNPTLLQLTVNLHPTNAFSCRAFPSGLVVTVMAYEAAANSISVVDGYNYQTSNQIVLNGVDFGAARPSYIQLNISSVAHYTLVDVFTLRWEMSRFQGCFEEDSEYEILQNQISLVVKATGACYQMKYLKQIEIVDGSFFNLLHISEDSQTLVDGVALQSIDPGTQEFPHYGSGVTLNFTQAGDFISELQQVLETPTIIFKMKTPGGLQIEAPLTLKRKILGHSRYFLTQSSLFQLDDSIAMNFIPNDTLIQQYQSLIDSCDSVIYRISVKTDPTTDLPPYIMQIIKPGYDAETKILRFACSIGDMECKTTLTKAVEAPNAQYEFDISFLQSTNLKMFLSAEIERFETCWRSGVVYMAKSSQICFDLHVHQGTTLCPFQKAQTATTLFQIASTTLPEIFEFTKTKLERVSLSQHVYCYDCGKDKECSKRFKQALNKPDKMFFFNATTPTQWAGIPMAVIIKGNYLPVIICACTIGAILAILSIVYTTYQMSKVRQQVKLLRNGLKAGNTKDKDD